MQSNPPKTSFILFYVLFFIFSLFNPAQNQASNFLLNTLPRLHHTLVSRKEETLARRPQSFHGTTARAANNIAQPQKINIDSALGFADGGDFAENGLALPVLQTEP